MKSQELFVAIMLSVSLLLSCRKEQDVRMEMQARPVVFRLGDAVFSAAINTKATPLDDGFYVSAATGAAGAETPVWTSIRFTPSEDDPDSYVGDKWWPLENHSYHFYASNAPLQYSAAGAEVQVSSGSDIVCAYLPSPEYKGENTLTFNHIFAFIESVSISAADGYSISDVDIRITPVCGGKYNIRAGDGFTDGTGWRNTVVGETQHIAPASSGIRRPGLYLVPGTYILSLSWTATTATLATDHYQANASIMLAAGKKSQLSCTLGGTREVSMGVALEPWVTVDVVDNPSCLAFYAVEDGAFLWKCSYEGFTRTIEYSCDFGRSWQSITSSSAGSPIPVSAGDIVWFRGNNTEYADANRHCSFDSSGTFYAYGDIASLLPGDGSVLPAYCFRHLFSTCSTLRIHPRKRLRLSATTLGDYCYKYMFSQCSGLAYAPEMAATHVGEYSCENMFNQCPELLDAPSLPATELASFCYKDMFDQCFKLCSPPELPAQKLAWGCYMNMFLACTSLTAAPRLPAKILVEKCYQSMFQACSSLQYVNAQFQTMPGEAYTKDWLKGVSSTGTFVKSASAAWNVRGNSGIPQGWTVQTQ